MTTFRDSARRIAAISALTICTSGCMRTAGDKDGLGEFSPKDVVLTRAAATIGTSPMELHLRSPVTVQGDVFVCLVLDSGVQYDTREKVDAHYKTLLGHARPQVVVHDPHGNEFLFSEGHQSWTEYGRVSSGGELSDCVSGEVVKTNGLQVAYLELSSDIPLKILGAYLSSTPSLK